MHRKPRVWKCRNLNIRGLRLDIQIQLNTAVWQCCLGENQIFATSKRDALGRLSRQIYLA